MSLIGLLKAFAAGFAATLLFHQGLFALLHAAGAVPVPAYNFTPTAPLGVPAVLSLAFWGGIWGLVIAALIGHRTGAQYWLWAMALGAIGPSAVALGLVFPLKGLPVDGRTVVGALMLNAAWGLGLALLLRWMRAGAATDD
jgi:hypothetical protein